MINRFLYQIVRILGILTVGYLFLQGLFTICCIQRVEEKTYYIQNDVLRQIIGIGLFSVLVWLLQKKKMREVLERYSKVCVIAAIVVVLAALGIWIYITDYWYFGDMEKAYQYAGMLLAGDFSGWQPGGYPYMWSQQNGLILFIAMLIKVFGTSRSFMAFYYFNLVAYGMTLAAIYVLVKRLFRDVAEVTLQSLMVIFYIPYGFLITILYGDIAGYAFGILSLTFAVCYLEDRRLWQIVGSCGSIVVAVFFKQNVLIFFVGIMILLLADGLDALKQIGTYEKGEQEKSDRAFLDKRYAGLIVAVLYAAVAVAGFGLPNALIEGMGHFQIEGGNSKWANVAMGLQESDKAPGWYNTYEEEVFARNHYDGAATAAEAEAEFWKRVDYFHDNPAYGWRFMNAKLASEWNNPTFECFHIQNWRMSGKELPGIVRSIINDGGKLNIILIALLDMAQSIVLFGVLLYLADRREGQLKQLIGVCLFIGGFVFFSVWEAKGRYCVPYYLMLIPYAWPGYTGLFRAKRARIAAAVCAVLAVLILISPFEVVRDSLKMGQDTEDYYDYIHQYDHNFENFRF